MALIEEMWLTDFRARPKMKDVVDRLEACTCVVGASAGMANEEHLDPGDKPPSDEHPLGVIVQELKMAELKTALSEAKAQLNMEASRRVQGVMQENENQARVIRRHVQEIERQGGEIKRLKRENERLQLERAHVDVFPAGPDEETEDTPLGSGTHLQLQTIRMAATMRSQRRHPHGQRSKARRSSSVAAAADGDEAEEAPPDFATTMFSTLRMATEAPSPLALVKAAPTTKMTLGEMLKDEDAFVVVGDAYVDLVKQLKDDDPTEDFVNAFLAANLPQDCEELVPMLRQILLPITKHVRVAQKMAKYVCSNCRPRNDKILVRNLLSCA